MDIAEEDEGDSNSDPEEALTARPIPATRSKEAKNPLIWRMASTLESPMNHYNRTGDHERRLLEERVRVLEDEYDGLRDVKRGLRETEDIVYRLTEDLKQAQRRKDSLYRQLRVQEELQRSFFAEIEEPLPHLPVPLSAQSDYRMQPPFFPEIEREMQIFKTKLMRVMRRKDVSV